MHLMFATSGMLAGAKKLAWRRNTPLAPLERETDCVVIFWYKNTHKRNKTGCFYGLKAINFVKKRHKNSEKRVFFGVFRAYFGCFWGKNGSIWHVITAFLGVFRAFLGLKVFQMYQLFHLYRGTIRRGYLTVLPFQTYFLVLPIKPT